jgi:hypothetical protein
MTTHDKPSDRVESVVKYLRTPGVGSQWGGSRFEEAADLIEDQQAEIAELRIELAEVKQDNIEEEEALRTRAEQAEAQLAAMQGGLEG